MSPSVNSGQLLYLLCALSKFILILPTRGHSPNPTMVAPKECQLLISHCWPVLWARSPVEGYGHLTSFCSIRYIEWTLLLQCVAIIWRSVQTLKVILDVPHREGLENICWNKVWTENIFQRKVWSKNIFKKNVWVENSLKPKVGGKFLKQSVDGKF